MIYVSSGRRLEFPASPFAGGRSFPQFTFICRGTAHTPPNWYLPNYICLIKTQFSTQFEYICHAWNFDETKMKSFVHRSGLQVQRQQNWIELHLNLNCLTGKEMMVVHNVHGCGASGSSNFQWTELSGLHPCLLLNILLNILEQIRIDVERKVVDYFSALNALCLWYPSPFRHWL